MTWVLLVRVFCLVLGFLSLYDICFMSFSSFLGGFVVLWQVCNSTGQRTPAIYQSNHCINASHTRTHTKTHSTLQLMRRWTFDLDIELTHGQPASCWARPVNIDDGLEAIMWIRCLGGERLPTASYALRPNLNKLFFSPRSSSERRDGDFLSSVFYTPADDTPSISIQNKPTVNALRVGQGQ